MPIAPSSARWAASSRRSWRARQALALGAVSRRSARTRRGDLDARPGAGRARRAGVSRLQLSRPTATTVSACRPRGCRRRGFWRKRACSAASASTSFRCGGRQLAALRHRGQPAQGRHDASLPHAAIPDRRRYDPATGLFNTPDGRSALLLRVRQPANSERYRGLSPDDLIDIAVRSGFTSTARPRRASCSI